MTRPSPPTPGRPSPSGEPMTRRLAITLLLMLGLVTCRPHAEEAPEGAFVATHPDADGFTSLTAEPGTLGAETSVEITNTTRDVTHLATASSTGSLTYDLEATTGDVLDILYTDPEAALRTAIVVVPLQTLSLHGAISEVAATQSYDEAVTHCLVFTPDDLGGEGETGPYELIGDHLDEVRAATLDAGETDVRLIGVPVLFGLSACGLPLFEPDQVLPESTSPPPSWHGVMVQLAPEGGGAGCLAFEATEQLPLPGRDQEPPPARTFTLAGAVGEGLTSTLTVGQHLVVEGYRQSTQTSACGPEPVNVVSFVLDTGELLSLDGALSTQASATAEDGDCLRLRVPSGPAAGDYSLVGPLAERQPDDGEERPGKIAGYVSTGVAADTCGSPLTLAQLPPQGEPGQGPPSGGLR